MNTIDTIYDILRKKPEIQLQHVLRFVEQMDDYEEDPFYSESNMKILKQSIKEADEGKLTKHDLIED